MTARSWPPVWAEAVRIATVAPMNTRIAWRISEREPSSNLQHASAAGAGDPSEVDVVHAQLGVVVVFAVERVERCDAGLHAPSRFAEREILRDRRVKALGSRAARHVEHVRAGTKRGVGDRTHRNAREAGRVQVVAPAWVAAVP